jgi:RNA recognition motif-containing protein
MMMANRLVAAQTASLYGSFEPSRYQKTKSSLSSIDGFSLPSPGEMSLSRTNLYIRGLTQNTTDDDLYELCKDYGKVISTKAIIDPTLSKCRGYGFVDFELEEDAQRAVNALQSRGIQAQMAKQQEQDPTNLYFANLPPSFNEDALERMLADYGQVTSTRILRDHFDTSRGVGFARMESKEKCDAIIQAFNGKVIQGNRQPLLVKFADGGVKKKRAFSNTGRSWTDRPQDNNLAITLYNSPGAMQQGLASQLTVAPSGAYARSYPSYQIPMTGYQVQSPGGWYNLAAGQYGQYIVHPSMTAVMPGMMPAGVTTIDPSMLAAQMSHLQINSDGITAAQNDLHAVDG